MTLVHHPRNPWGTRGIAWPPLIPRDRLVHLAALGRFPAFHLPQRVSDRREDLVLRVVYQHIPVGGHCNEVLSFSARDWHTDDEASWSLAY